MSVKEVSAPKERNEHVSMEHQEQLEARHQAVQVDESLYKTIVRKYDLHLLILFVVINLFCFIDRVNIGNVRLLGLSSDLQLHVGLRYNTAIMCLFVPYCFVELPANIICKKLGGHIWIPLLVTIFATLTVLMTVVQSYQALYAVRFLLGLVEGGVSPGLIWIMSLFYRRNELGFRNSIYVSAASASGAFGGLLAIGFSKIPQWGMVHTWRNVYFFEGIMSLCVAIPSWWMIPRGPETAKFLTEVERTTAVNRILIDSAGTTEFGRSSLMHIRQALSSPHVLGCAIGFFFTNTVAQSVAVFSPSIIKGMGYSNTAAQLLSVGPYAVACIVSILVGWISDRRRQRALPIIFMAPLAIAGFVLLEFVPDHIPALKYGALYLACPGYYSFYPIWLTWAANNCATATMRAAGLGIVLSLGNLAGICAPWIYLPDDAPGYRTGHAILLSFMCGTWVCAIILRVYCRWDNRQKEQGRRDHLLEGLSRLEELELSSKHPSFRYIY